MDKVKNMAALYVRLSKEDADKMNNGDDSESIQNQKLILMAYAKEHHFNIYNIYCDDDYCGFSNRPAFNQMIKDGEKGCFDILICKHQSRFARDMELIEKYVHGLFIQWGIRFISITDHVDTALKGSKKSRQINGLINEWYCEDLSENVKSVMKAKRQQGQFVGAFACYGYKKDPQDKNKLLIDEEAAVIVQEIFRLYLSGLGIEQIAGTLSLRKIPTPSQYKKMKGSNYENPNEKGFSMKYGAWPVNTIRRILTNEMYIGNMVQGKEMSISYKTKKTVKVPKEQWDIVKKTHEGIIAVDDFNKVQQFIAYRRKSYKSTGEIQLPSYNLLSGKLFCMDCGSPLIRGGQSRDGKVKYYCCKLAKKTHQQACSSHSVSGYAIEKRLKEQILAYWNECILTTGYDEIVSEITDQFYENKRLKPLAMKKVGMEQDCFLTLYQDRLKGLITEEEFLILKEDLASQNGKGEFHNTLDLEKPASLEKKQIMDMAMKLIHSDNPLYFKDQSIINKLVERITVSERKEGVQEIMIHWHF